VTPAAPSRRFYYLRVSILLLVLGGVLGYAALDHARRSARRQWRRPLHVALVLLQQGELDPAALALLQARIEPLEEVLEAEFARYGGSFRPVRFHPFGPVPQPAAPPEPTGDSSLFESLRLSLALGAFARRADRAAGVDAGNWDGKVYVLLSAPWSARRALVEGLGEDGGRIAVTSLELSEDSVDFGLFVVAHELLHLLGAEDRYGPDGLTLLPEGLGAPQQEPRFPQRKAEVMARGLVLEPGVERPPGQLDELSVGPLTAAEIGWSVPAESSPANLSR
jgi:hypothetical protein